MWEVNTTDVFDRWFLAQDESLRESVLAAMRVLKTLGPHLGRPYVDTLKGVAYPNMKELRVQHSGAPVRAFFAFDPVRQAIILCAGDKTGVNEKRFYQAMINLAEKEYRHHIASMEK
ncbi:type II toxin-antitoxin system RelE/ParE family toxin [Dryocola clanedunensis]|uniref:type II toxin-antitoxin system RelE/ParE family toxin n=1 Tax=Cedecea sulfonylureivorans TaxID=3051154 RepID=UPI0019266B7D|nr:type II toxin-antitoxin system RelE/ParE family toxin [Cedecea sulfonylureivorans]